MSSDIFTRKAGELIFPNKIQQSKIIIIIGIREIMQFGIILRHGNKESNTQANRKRQAKKRGGDWEKEGQIEKERGDRERERVNKTAR